MPLTGAACVGSVAVVIAIAICLAATSYFASYFAWAATGCALSCFFFQSPIAARIASSASTEQWIFTGGSDSSFTMSMFLLARASSTVLPLTHSVARDDDAIAQPQPTGLTLASSTTLFSRLTLISIFLTSP